MDTPVTRNLSRLIDDKSEIHQLIKTFLALVDDEAKRFGEIWEKASFEKLNKMTIRYDSTDCTLILLFRHVLHPVTCKSRKAWVSSSLCRVTGGEKYRNC